MNLTFDRNWKHITAVRTFLQSMMTSSVDLGQATSPELVAMAVGELLENAVKYSASDEVRVGFRIAEDPAPRLAIEVENPATREQIETVKAQYHRAMAGDPLETYMTLMREAATRSDGQSQLGLIRIRYESGGVLDLTTTDSLVKFTLILTPRSLS